MSWALKTVKSAPHFKGLFNTNVRREIFHCKCAIAVHYTGKTKEKKCYKPRCWFLFNVDTGLLQLALYTLGELSQWLFWQSGVNVQVLSQIDPSRPLDMWTTQEHEGVLLCCLLVYLNIRIWIFCGDPLGGTLTFTISLMKIEKKITGGFVSAAQSFTLFIERNSVFLICFNFPLSFISAAGFWAHKTKNKNAWHCDK